jgi:peptide chain release factor subunit 3
MSKLNAGAFSFVPGRSFIPPQPSQNPPPPPLERPEQTEVPRPAPTISLNIGGTPSSSTPAPVTPASPVAQFAKPSRGSEESSNIPSHTKKIDIPVSTSTKPSKTFTTERAKTDTNAIAQEVKAVADRAILEDLYGTCKYDFN